MDKKIEELRSQISWMEEDLAVLKAKLNRLVKSKLPTLPNSRDFRKLTN